MKEFDTSNRLGRLRALSHHVTWFLGTRFPRTFPFVFVVGYPKSGTTWVSQLVADYLGLPFPRFSLLPVGCPAVVHGHERVWKRYPRAVYVMRDGRDALVSHFFFLARGIPPGENPPLNRVQRRYLPGLRSRDDLESHFTRFVDIQMTRPLAARANWGNHVLSCFEVENPNVVRLRYEDLLHDGENALGQAMSALTGEPADPQRLREALARFSFERQSGRKKGQANPRSFLRKGQAGDWRNHFTREAAEIFDHHCGEALIRAGYEADRSWVENLGREPEHAPREGDAR